VQVGELDRRDVADVQPEGAAKFDRVQLVRVTDQPDLPPCRSGVGQ